MQKLCVKKAQKFVLKNYLTKNNPALKKDSLKATVLDSNFQKTDEVKYIYHKCIIDF